MVINRHLILIVASIICFLVALLLSLSVLHGGNAQTWELGGLLSLAASFLP